MGVVQKISMEVKDALPRDLPIALRRAKRQREEVNYKEESLVFCFQNLTASSKKLSCTLLPYKRRSLRETEPWSKYITLDTLVNGMNGVMKKNWKA